MDPWGKGSTIGERFLTAGRRRRAARHQEEIEMTLCPVALAASCKKCPIVSVCPLKTVLGDYPKTPETKPDSDTPKSSSKKS